MTDIRSNTVTCRFCSRDRISLYPTTGNMRFHRVPKGVDVGVIGIRPGDRCPGTSSDSYWTARLDLNGA